MRLLFALTLMLSLCPLPLLLPCLPFLPYVAKLYVMWFAWGLDCIMRRCLPLFNLALFLLCLCHPHPRQLLSASFLIFFRCNFINLKARFVEEEFSTVCVTLSEVFFLCLSRTILSESVWVFVFVYLSS